MVEKDDVRDGAGSDCINSDMNGVRVSAENKCSDNPASENWVESRNEFIRLVILFPDIRE